MKKTNEIPINKSKEIPASSKKEILSPIERTPAPEQSDPIFRFIDKLYQANLGKLTVGISPAALNTAYHSWLAQLLQSPGSMLRLACYPLLHANDYLYNLFKYDKPRDGKDVRFHTDNWGYYPWRLWAEQFLQFEDWCLQASGKIPGLPLHVKRTVTFSTRQILDALSPSNFVLTNPDLLQETIRSNGQNLIRGTELAFQDFLEKITGSPPAGVENFIPGKQVAVTKGKVVYSNHLIELIQYAPQTEKVYKEPILILPAWIMKYYILDLLPENSLVNWLVSQGHTVFIVSWRNPTKEDRNLGLDDYYRLGAMDAINAVSNAIPHSKIHLMGYCLGGTLALLTAAAMAHDQDNRLKTLSLLAAQGDFIDAGELLLFITKSEVSFLKSMMWEQGYLDTKQMSGAFQMLRTYDLIWSKMVQDYMHGTQRGMIPLLAWNADATRMPYKMHSEYLEKLFLNNDFAEGRFILDGKPVVGENIRIPAFVVSTEKDHVAPWKSVYKTHLLINSDITFVLANGGHNAGIVSEPGHEGRYYHIRERKKDSTYLDPKTWLKKAEFREGSWWIAWHDWLVIHSSKKQVSAPKLDKKLPNAPGKYVLQK
ncbi:alpha/beta fold hydrolase [Legionella pneumophila serogroup 1]|uniref:PHA/PHB synthase family protein n=1 Tax=Legionella pneumophila TaxID=446 RepID=UPI0001D2045A|nr:alpha/beta fold hydrolase [Legionella pneumophila]ADG25600.1 polyhydroxyalkanoate synthase [Legionella pneumophila 2300/99 Alcoy]MCO1453009.1 alpha/beta fold hydrolase [Legionella pneumophila]MCW8403122.1 alpha/beta fold hydrolase [Legionella pneumophila]MCW8458235.1 alpha/beta fold hydrolase [Legionella pneumophila]MCZ4698625.1 alpha/beta fold hydrolase [Legionella pneumophila]